MLFITVFHFQQYAFYPYVSFVTFSCNRNELFSMAVLVLRGIAFWEKKRLSGVEPILSPGPVLTPKLRHENGAPRGPKGRVHLPGHPKLWDSVGPCVLRSRTEELGDTTQHQLPTPRRGLLGPREQLRAATVSPPRVQSVMSRRLTLGKPPGPVSP